MPARILLVEDNPANQKVIKAFLEQAGYPCDVAATGAQALNLVHKSEYALILMDLRIPNLDGITAASALRQTGCDVPIIALTASARPDDEKRCVEAGMNDFMTKPFSKADFEQVIQKYLKPNQHASGQS